MADYKKMYAVLCGAVDNAVDELENIPPAKPCADRLTRALREAEEIYIDTTPYLAETADAKILRLTVDQQPTEE